MDFRNIPIDGEKGYMVCVDLEYPPHLHEEHQSFPLAVNEEHIDYSMLSPYAKSALHFTHDQPKNYRAKKLVGSFLPKKKYFCHHANLRFYLEKGLILKKVHSVLEFRQSRHMESYIKLTTDLRSKAKSVFKKNIWKKFNNALYVSRCYFLKTKRPT